MSLQVCVRVCGARVPARACTRALDREEYCTSVIMKCSSEPGLKERHSRAWLIVRTEQVNEERA